MTTLVIDQSNPQSNPAHGADSMPDIVRDLIEIGRPRHLMDAVTAPEPNESYREWAEKDFENARLDSIAGALSEVGIARVKAPAYPNGIVGELVEIAEKAFWDGAWFVGEKYRLPEVNDDDAEARARNAAALAVLNHPEDPRHARLVEFLGEVGIYPATASDSPATNERGCLDDIKGLVLRLMESTPEEQAETAERLTAWLEEYRERKAGA